MARLAIENEDEAELRRLRDDVDVAPVLTKRQQLRRLREVVVPQIVVHELLMPEPLAGARVERDQTVAEQVVSRPIPAIEIEARGAEGNKRDSVLRIDGQFAPVVNAACLLVRPSGQVSYPNSPGCGMLWKTHTIFPGPHVIRLDVSGRRLVAGTLRRQRDDDQVLENAARIARLQRISCLAPQRHAQIHAPVRSERRNRLAGLRVDGGEVAGVEVQQPAIRPIGALPVIDPSGPDRPLVGMPPDLFSGGRIERDDGVSGSLHVHDAVDDDWVERHVPVTG